jgi:hypothetical protein
MAFYKPIYPEWNKFPNTSVLGAKKRSSRFWDMGEIYTGNTGRSYVESTEIPQTEYLVQGSMMQTPSTENLGRFNPRYKKIRMSYGQAYKFLPTRGFAERTKLKRLTQFNLIPSAELPFMRKTKIPKYISSVQEIAGIKRPKKMSIWRGRTNYGMMRPTIKMRPMQQMRRRPTFVNW